MVELDFFSGKDCGVCQVLKPKLLEHVNEHFPNVVFNSIWIEDDMEYAAQHAVFTLPVVIIKWEGVEQYRFVRSFGVNEVLQKLQRLVELSS